MEIRFIDINVRREYLESDLKDILTEFMPDWPLDQINITELKGGLVNAMYKCWPKKLNHNNCDNDQKRSKKPIILRLFSFKFNKEKMVKDPASETNVEDGKNTNSCKEDLDSTIINHEILNKKNLLESVKDNSYVSEPNKNKNITHNQQNFDFEKIFFDRVNESLVMHRISELGLCSRVHGRFVNGYCYDYAEGTILDYSISIKPEFIQKFTKSLAIFHAARIETYANKSLVAMRDKMREFFEPFMIMLNNEIQTHLDKSKLAVYQKYPSFIQIHDEIRKLDSYLDKIGCGEIAFCHNDLNNKNVIWNEKKGQISFIDFEQSQPNYSCYDIATHFVCFCGNFLGEFDLNKLPSSEFRLNWIKQYLIEWNKEHNPGLCSNTNLFKQQVWDLHRRTTLVMGISFLRFSLLAPLFQFKPEMFQNNELAQKLKDHPECVGEFGISSFQGFELIKEEIFSLLKQEKPALIKKLELNLIN